MTFEFMSFWNRGLNLELREFVDLVVQEVEFLV